MCKREQRRETVFQTSRSLHRIEPPPHPLFLAHSWGSFCELLDLEAWAVDVVCSVSRRKIEEEGSWPIAQKMEKKEVRKKVLSIWKKLRAHGADWDDANERTRCHDLTCFDFADSELTLLVLSSLLKSSYPALQGNRDWDGEHSARDGTFDGIDNSFLHSCSHPVRFL